MPLINSPGPTGCTVREARCLFTTCIAALIIYIKNQPEMECALDEGMERLTAKDTTSDHMPNSLHHIGLAQDIVLYHSGKYLMDTAEYEFAGLFWEDLGQRLNYPLRWGGRFNDGNHFSWEWQGRK